jgi:dienelactone hydrolase
MPAHQDDLTTAVVSGVTIDIFGAAQRRGPVVFVVHGHGGAAQDVHEYCRDLASAGMVAVALDQRNHGRRLVDADANAGWGTSAPADMYSHFIGSALDVSLLVDMLPARLGLDTSRPGVTGFSLGGHAALAAMVSDERIACCAALIGSGDYRRMMELHAAAHGVPESEFGSYYPPRTAAHRRAIRSHPQPGAPRRPPHPHGERRSRPAGAGRVQPPS